jgi:hypothetical protein
MVGRVPSEELEELVPELSGVFWACSGGQTGPGVVSKGGVGGCTMKLARAWLGGGETGTVCVEIFFARGEDEDVLRGIRGRGELALFEV